MMCKRMKWTHLPHEGGLLDQAPELLDTWPIIWNIEAEIQKKDAEKHKPGRGGGRSQFAKSTI